MFWLLRDVGLKGAIVFVAVLTLMPIGVLWIAISQRTPAFLLVLLAWIIAMGYPGEWFANPFEGSPLWIIGAVVYVVSWVIVVGGSYGIAKELTS